MSNVNRVWRHRAVLAGTAVAVLAGSLLSVSPAQAQPEPVAPLRPQAEMLDADGGEVRGLGWKPEPRKEYSVPAPVWPAAATARVALPTSGARTAGPARGVRAGTLPVTVDRAPGASGAAVGDVSVEILDRSAMPASWRDTVLMRVGASASAGSGAASGSARVSLHYAAFRHAFGADWAARLTMYRLPECGLRTPERAGCRAEPLRSANDVAAGAVTADVPVPIGPASAAARSSTAAGTLVAVAADAAGPSGDFTATSLAPSSTWTSGGSSGDFSWSYPMRVPPAMGGPTPDVKLSYSSSSVDGKSAATNNQPSWVGEGFEFSPGFIERRYVPCAEDKSGSPNNPQHTGDLCWRSDNATMSLNGSGGELVWQKGKGWHSRVEDGSRIEKVTGGVNGDDNGEYWKVTTTDGTQYFFGLNKLPGQSTDTRSAWTVPVYGNHDGEPCNKAAFADSDCAQVWRWNLDYVVDARGNTMSYWYEPESNKYATRADEAKDLSYIRGGTLHHIDYGTWDRKDANGNLDRSTVPAAQVLFETADRCKADCGKHDGVHWPDVPWEQECRGDAASCPDNFSPTFWSTRRLAKITTRVWDTTKAPAAWQNVDSWAFSHSFPSPGDGTNAGLWLDSIVHTGEVGASKALPPVTFHPVAMPNRVLTKTNTTNNWQRLARIETETGARIQVTYSLPECRSGNLPAAPHTNTSLCYPVIGPDPYDPDGKDITEWWHKYVVRQVSETDVQLADGHQTPTRNTYYDYLDKPAWHYADDDGLSKPSRKTWDQFRGYQTVVTRVGDYAQTRTKTTYLRGMHGDRAAPGGGLRSVTVPASVGSERVYDEDAFAGMVREQVTYNGTEDKPVSKTVNVPWQSTPTAERTINGDTVSARFVNTRVTYQGTALGVDGGRGWRVGATRTDFDDTYGTVEWTQDDGDVNIGGDEKCTTYTYNRNTGANIVTLPKRVTATALPCGRTPTAEAHLISDVRNSYDGAGSSDTAPTRGLLSKVEQLNGWTAAGGTAFQVVSEATFDGFGRPVTGTDVRRNVTRTEYTPAGRGPVTRTTTTNAKQWVSTAELNPYWGSPRKTTDPNGRVAEATYDPLGRTAEVWNVGWSRADYPTLPSVRYQYSYAADRKTYPYVRTDVLHAAGKYKTTVQILDAFLRPRQIQTIGAKPGERVITDTIHDQWGRVETTYAAHAEPGDPSGNLWWEPEWSLPAINRTVFDRASRPVANIFLSGDGVTNLVERWRTTTVSEGDQTMVTPPAGGTPTTTVTDIFGRTTELRQHTSAAGVSGPSQKTTYSYDGRGKLTKVTDPLDNEWSYTFDVKGRQVEARDPDKGRSTSAYNDYDDVVSTTDANGRKLVYQYDDLGRKVALYDDSISEATKRAEWLYDRTYSGTRVRGQLVRTVRYDSGQKYIRDIVAFDQRYQPTRVVYTIPYTEPGIGGAWSFLRSYSDADGSPITATYPPAGGMANETVITKYDKFTGLPNALETYSPDIGSYVNQQLYSSYGEPTLTRRQTAGGLYVEEATTYDTYTRRVKRVQVQAERAAGTIADRAYDYDAAGNILSVADTPQVGEADNQCFRYDVLRRLTSAWTTKSGVDCKAEPSVDALGGPAPYWYDWTIDAIGNRTKEVSHSAAAEITRTYAVPPSGAGAVRPHAVTKVSTQVTGQPETAVSYSYDDAGNMVRRPGANGGEQVLNWDSEGRASKVAEGATTHSNVYDVDGTRLIRRDATGVTLYLPGMELRAETATEPASVSATRYYTLAGKLVASRTAADRSLTWLFNDHQGTQQLGVNAYTMQVSVRRQTPYGTPRGPQPEWANLKGFVGGDIDPTGLTHVGAREYDPHLGRFISVDPVQDMSQPQQWNGYAYGNNSPISQSDPTGLDPCLGGGGGCYHDGYDLPGKSAVPSKLPGAGCGSANACESRSNGSGSSSPKGRSGCAGTACPKTISLSCQSGSADIGGSINGSYSCPTDDTNVPYKSMGDPPRYCSFWASKRCDDLAVAEIGLEVWWSLSCGGFVAGKNVTEACPLMNHYAEGSGDDWIIDVDDLMGSSEFAESVGSSTSQVEGIAADRCRTGSCTFTFDTGWKEMSFEENKSEDHYYGYRGMTYQVRGAVTVSRGPGGAYSTTGSYQVTAYKAWNFDKNESLRGVSFKGPAYAAGFGLAREFAVVGTGQWRSW